MGDRFYEQQGLTITDFREREYARIQNMNPLERALEDANKQQKDDHEDRIP